MKMLSVHPLTAMVLCTMHLQDNCRVQELQHQLQAIVSCHLVNVYGSAISLLDMMVPIHNSDSRLAQSHVFWAKCQDTEGNFDAQLIQAFVLSRMLEVVNTD